MPLFIRQVPWFTKFFCCFCRGNQSDSRRNWVKHHQSISNVPTQDFALVLETNFALRLLCKHPQNYKIKLSLWRYPTPEMKVTWAQKPIVFGFHKVSLVFIRVQRFSSTHKHRLNHLCMVGLQGIFATHIGNRHCVDRQWLVKRKHLKKVFPLEKNNGLQR